jgi:hypothetical protein
LRTWKWNLLSAVASSGCEFYRNGEWHDSQKASAHLRDKYNALAALGRAATAMEFIEEAATKIRPDRRALRIATPQP